MNKIPLNGGCSLYVGGVIVAAVGGVTDATGGLDPTTFALPESLNGDLYWQWFQVDPVSNALSATEGLHMAVW